MPLSTDRDDEEPLRVFGDGDILRAAVLKAGGGRILASRVDLCARIQVSRRTVIQSHRYCWGGSCTR